LAACLTKQINPHAPYVIQCGKWVIIESAGESLSIQKNSIPVLIKLHINRWLYKELNQIKSSYTSGPDYLRLIRDSKREVQDISRVIEIEPVEN